MNQDLYHQIVSAYKQTGSVDRTAQLCGTYPIKVRKVLITEGLWHSKKSDAVNSLRNRGYSVSEIAETLGMDEKNVQFYLPYTDHTFSAEKSESRTRVRNFRERCRKNEEGSLFRGNKNEEESPKGFCFMDSREAYACNIAELGNDSNRQAVWNGYQLHIELIQNAWGSENEDGYDIFRDEKNVVSLRSLLKTKHGISRDIIVPGKMSLHQLSYVILELFGFMNNHLHHFSLPKPLFRQLTGETTANWAEMCGVYLHVPVTEDFSDLYWDDDYKQGKSAKTWKRSKYEGLKKNYAVGETYIDSLRLLKEEMDWIREAMEDEGDHRSFQDLSMEEYRREYAVPGEVNMLLERLKVEELFSLKTLQPRETEQWREAMEKDTDIALTYMEAFRETNAFRSLEAAMAALRQMREDRDTLDRAIWTDRNETMRTFGKNPDLVLDELEKEIHRTEQQIGDAMHVFDPPARPITDTLYYHYDYGDGWLFRVSCREIYTRYKTVCFEEENKEALQAARKKSGSRGVEIENKMAECYWNRDYMEDIVFEDSRNREVHNMLYVPLCTAFLESKPVCVATEGLPLVEDVGGVGGFFDFIRTIHGENAEEAASLREWARSLGWKGIVPKPEGLL